MSTAEITNYDAQRNRLDMLAEEIADGHEEAALLDAMGPDGRDYAALGGQRLTEPAATFPIQRTFDDHPIEASDHTRPAASRSAPKTTGGRSRSSSRRPTGNVRGFNDGERREGDLEVWEGNPGPLSAAARISIAEAKRGGPPKYLPFETEKGSDQYEKPTEDQIALSRMWASGTKARTAVRRSLSKSRERAGIKYDNHSVARPIPEDVRLEALNRFSGLKSQIADMKVEDPTRRVPRANTAATRAAELAMAMKPPIPEAQIGAVVQPEGGPSQGVLDAAGELQAATGWPHAVRFDPLTGSYVAGPIIPRR